MPGGQLAKLYKTVEYQITPNTLIKERTETQGQSDPLHREQHQERTETQGQSQTPYTGSSTRNAQKHRDRVRPLTQGAAPGTQRDTGTESDPLHREQHQERTETQGQGQSDPLHREQHQERTETRGQSQTPYTGSSTRNAQTPYTGSTQERDRDSQTPYTGSSTRNAQKHGDRVRPLTQGAAPGTHRDKCTKFQIKCNWFKKKATVSSARRR